MNESVLLTGATGFIGSHLAPHLQGQGYSVRPFDRDQADLLEPDTLAAQCQDVHHVLHLAAYAHVNRADTEALRAINVTGTSNLLAAAIEAQIPHFLYMSSILADPAHDQPRTPYGESKREAENLLLQAHRAGDIRVTILRPVNVYGPGMKGNLLTLIRMTRRGWMPPLPDKEQPLSLIGVQDLCRAVHCALQRVGDSEAPEHPVYPVTDGERYTFKAIERSIRKAFGQDNPDWYLPSPGLYLAAMGMEVLSRLFRLKNGPGLRSYRSLTRGQFVDDTAARNELRYNPESNFHKELPRILDALDFAHKAR